MKYKEKLRVLLDSVTYKRISGYSRKNNVSISEIMRVVIDKTHRKFKIKSLREVKQEGHEKGKTEKNLVLFYVSEKHIKKIKALTLKHDTSLSEVVRVLLKTDINKYKYTTRNEKIKQGKAVAEKEKIKRIIRKEKNKTIK